MKELLDKILAIGIVFKDHTDEKPSVIYGHPDTKQWANIFITAVKLKDKL
jgi:hypothetical protein